MEEQSYNPVSQPKHYSVHPSGIEPINITKHESFLRGNAIKYIMRAPYKGTELQDIRKAIQYLEWEAERLEKLEVESIIGPSTNTVTWPNGVPGLVVPPREPYA